MSFLYQLTMDPKISIEKAWDLLDSQHIPILYGAEEKGQLLFFVHLDSAIKCPPLKEILAIAPYSLPSIDWEDQWKEHGHNFHDGYVHIHLADFKADAPSFLLKPGAGFGDFSHPTTIMALELLTKYIHDQVIIDVGSGSGILALAGAALGASFVYGIDIDPQAVKHAYQNSLLNHLENKTFFCSPEAFHWNVTQEPVLVVMNMIQSEQIEAWNSLNALQGQTGICITSGIRHEERESYLEQVRQWGFLLLEEAKKGDWMAFAFTLPVVL